MLPVVAAEGGKLYASTRDVSDNCGLHHWRYHCSHHWAQLMNWQNIEFLCDMANTMRNVVGIGSVGAASTTLI